MSKERQRETLSVCVERERKERERKRETLSVCERERERKKMIER